MTEPLITIGITCFNAAETIVRAIKSAQQQTWENLEIVVVDDCSSDRSAALVEEISRENPKIRLIRHAQNQGPAAARQTIVDEAKGEYICFFDDDDESDPQRCGIQFERIAAYEKETGQVLVACYCSGIRRYPNGYEFTIQAIGSKPAVPQGTDIANYILFFGKRDGVFYGAGTPTCALMARKTTIQNIGGFDPAFRRVEDLDFSIRLGLAGGHFIGCSEKLLIQHATEGGDKAPRKNLDAELQLVEKNKEYLKSVGRYDYAQRWPVIRYHHFCGQHLKMMSALMILFSLHPLQTGWHFLQTAPKRLIHEFKMKRRA